METGISETVFSSQVEDLLRLYRWTFTHFRPAYTSKGYRTPLTGDRGFPDYCCVRDGRLLFIEIKSEDGKATTHQEIWLDLLDHVKGIEVYLLKPSQFEELRALLA